MKKYTRVMCMAVVAMGAWATASAEEDRSATVDVSSVIQSFQEDLIGDTPRPAQRVEVAPQPRYTPPATQGAWDTSSVVEARVKLSAPYADNNELRRDIALSCTPTVAILPSGKMTQAQLHRTTSSFGANWPYRSYEVLSIARNGNVVQMLVHYKRRGAIDYSTGVVPEIIQGYSLMTVHVTADGKISALGEKASRTAPPAFSPGMRPEPYHGQRVFGQCD